jgi:polyisoprenoid-binding protein YceI
MRKTNVVARLAGVMVVSVLATCGAYAQSAPSTITVHLDPAETKIAWTLDSVLHTVHGTFEMKGGLVVLNEKTGSAQGEIIIETASGKSGNDTRDGRMKKDVLESAKYPEAIFHPAKITGFVNSGETQTITVEGMFTIHGADHPLTLQVETTVKGDRVTAKTSFTVPYVAWGMKDPSTFMLHVEKEVKVEVNAQGSLK